MVKELLALAPRLCNKDFQPYNALRNACMKNDPSKRSDILEIVQLLISQGMFLTCIFLSYEPVNILQLTMRSYQFQ